MKRRRWILLSLFTLLVVLVTFGKKETHWEATQQQREEEIANNGAARALYGPAQMWRQFK